MNTGAAAAWEARISKGLRALEARAPEAVPGGFILICAIAAFLIVTLSPAPRVPVATKAYKLSPVDFADIPGWAKDAHAKALSAFRRSCPRMRDRDLKAACASAKDHDAGDARDFFEDTFEPFLLVLVKPGGILTAYYEPVVLGSRTKTEKYNVPLLALPEDLVRVTGENRPEGFDPDLGVARKTAAGLVPYPTRAEIAAGAIDDVAVPLAFVEDPVDAFFIHIQGSTRIAFDDGGSMRLGYAGKNGHQYSSIGKAMIARDMVPSGGMSMDSIRGFFKENPDKVREILNVNASYIFFREIEGLDVDLGPVGAQGVALTSGRSIAVDRRHHELGLPFFIAAELPTGKNRAYETFQRLMIAQDTGSAIKGPARADLFWGTGLEAGSIAGGIKETGTFWLLKPKPVPSG